MRRTGFILIDKPSQITSSINGSRLHKDNIKEIKILISIPEKAVEQILECVPKEYVLVPEHQLAWKFCHTGLQFY